MDGHDNGADGTANNLDKSNTGGASGGIFSTPDLTVNTENLPQNQPAKPASAAPRFNFGRRANRGNTSAESSERVASAFAQTDASQQAERLSDAMLESANATTRSTATGDIQLDVPKKKKRWPWVVGVLIILAVASGTAWALLSQGASQNNITDTLRRAFNEYANYFLYNSSSDANLEGLYQYGEMYYLDELSDNSQIDAHLAESEDKYRNFLDIYKKYIAEQPDDQTTIDYTEQLESYFESLDLFRYIVKRPNIGANTVLEEFIASPDDVSSRLSSYYDVFAESSMEATREYGMEYKAQLNALTNAYRVLESEGCIENDVLLLTCRIGSDNDQIVRANETYMDFVQFYNDVSEQYNSISISVYQDIWKINLELL